MVYFPTDSPSFLLHVLGLVLTAGVSLVVARWIDRQETDEAGRTMVGLLLVHAVMATLVLVQLLVESPAVERALTRTWYGLILGVPAVWFLFAVYYTGRDHWLTTPVRLLLVVSALGPFALSLTEPLHELLVEEWVTRTDPFYFQQGVLTGLNAAFFLLISLLTLAGFALLFRLALFSRRSSRWQSIGLLLGMLSVHVPAALSTTTYVPVVYFPYGIYGAGVFGVLVAIALFRNRLFAVAPLARDTLFESLDDAVVVVNEDHRIVDFNDRALEIFPRVEGATGTPLADVYPDLVGTADWQPDLEGNGPQVASSEETPFAGTIRRTVDGTTRNFNVAVSEISSGGKRRGYGLVVSDITDLVAYSTELERKTERLEQFASVLSHDLRNPVNVAMGRVEIERQSRDTEHLESAMEALDRIEATIDDLLTLARSGESVYDPTAVSLKAVVEDAWETSDTGDATLSVAVDEQYRVRADWSRLRTLLENLFRNAADHGGSTVAVAPLDSGFSVADDGPGVPADERETVFEYGYTTADTGTGFGLAIVESVAEAHDWTVDVTETEPADLPERATGNQRDRPEGGSGDPGARVGARFEIRNVETVGDDTVT